VPVRSIALVPAAGRGDRFGAGVPKQFLELGGKPLLRWTLERLLVSPLDGVVVALPATGVPAGVLPEDQRLRVVEGAATRQASVLACLQGSGALADDLVVVHDGARPAVHPDDVRSVCEAAQRADGAVLGRRLADTVKRIEAGNVIATIDRAGMFRAETPQVFRREVFDRACAAALAAGFLGTDESSLVERLDGVRIIAVEARYANPKLTVAADWPWIASLLQARL
jgi:2-C-methyl-D-erythritol 4-phosphate cytidylyltransferase